MNQSPPATTRLPGGVGTGVYPPRAPSQIEGGFRITFKRVAEKLSLGELVDSCFERPHDNSWIVGQPEVGRCSLGILPLCDTPRLVNRVRKCEVCTVAH